MPKSKKIIEINVVCTQLWPLMGAFRRRVFRARLDWHARRAVNLEGLARNAPRVCLKIGDTRQSCVLSLYVELHKKACPCKGNNRLHSRVIVMARGVLQNPTLQQFSLRS
ncbi:hypothetical protein QTP88_001119 [Uroleucon formosanum]